MAAMGVLFFAAAAPAGGQVRIADLQLLDKDGPSPQFGSDPNAVPPREGFRFDVKNNGPSTAFHPVLVDNYLPVIMTFNKQATDAINDPRLNRSAFGAICEAGGPGPWPFQVSCKLPPIRAGKHLYAYIVFDRDLLLLTSGDCARVDDSGSTATSDPNPANNGFPQDVLNSCSGTFIERCGDQPPCRPDTGASRRTGQ